MANKRILLVNKYYSPSTGGIETAVKQYAHWYQECDHEVTVLCCANNRMMRSCLEFIDGIQVLRTASLGNLLSVPLSLAFFWHFFRLALKSDVIHINLQFPSASLALFLTHWLIKGKTVVSYHCDVYRQRHLKEITYLFDRYVVRRANLVITGSPALRKYSEVLGGIHREIDAVPYSIDMEYVARCLKQSSALEIPEHFQREGYCVFFGRLVSYKGTESLNQAFRLLMERQEPTNLLVFGTGPEESHFRKLAEEFPRSVHFINAFVSDVDKYHLIRGARLFLFPSVYYSEAFGIAQLDAMACGKPVLNCWLNTGVNWVAPDREAAYTIAPGDAEQLAEAITYLLSNPDRLTELGQGGLDRCQRLFAETAVKARFIEVVGSL